MSSANGNHDQVRKLRIACVGVAVALAIGLWFHMPYLSVEHRRLETWKIAGLWINDAAALLWFGRFVFIHAILGRPLTELRLSNGRARFKLVALAIVGTMLLDLAFTLYLMSDERASYVRGLVTDAKITRFHERKRPETTWYEFDCSFKDEAGLLHETHLRVIAKHHVLPTTLPREVANALTVRGEGHEMIRIRYDRHTPARACIDGLGWEDENGLYWFSLLTLLFQAIGTLLFLLLLWQQSERRILPWWWEVHKALPLAVETFWMLTTGLIDLLMDSLM